MGVESQSYSVAALLVMELRSRTKIMLKPETAYLLTVLRYSNSV